MITYQLTDFVFVRKLWNKTGYQEDFCAHNLVKTFKEMKSNEAKYISQY